MVDICRSENAPVFVPWSLTEMGRYFPLWFMVVQTLVFHHSFVKIIFNWSTYKSFPDPFSNLAKKLELPFIQTSHAISTLRTKGGHNLHTYMCTYMNISKGRLKIWPHVQGGYLLPELSCLHIGVHLIQTLGHHTVTCSTSIRICVTRDRSGSAKRSRLAFSIWNPEALCDIGH